MPMLPERNEKGSRGGGCLEILLLLLLLVVLGFVFARVFIL